MKLFLQRFKATTKELLEYILVYGLDGLISMAKGLLSLVKVVLFIVCLVSLPLWCIPANILKNRKMKTLVQLTYRGQKRQ